MTSRIIIDIIIIQTGAGCQSEEKNTNN